MFVQYTHRRICFNLRTLLQDLKLRCNYNRISADGKSYYREIEERERLMYSVSSVGNFITIAQSQSGSRMGFGRHRARQIVGIAFVVDVPAEREIVALDYR